MFCLMSWRLGPGRSARPMDKVVWGSSVIILGWEEDGARATQWAQAEARRGAGEPTNRMFLPAPSQAKEARGQVGPCVSNESGVAE
jgi:hypothetical protein